MKGDFCGVSLHDAQMTYYRQLVRNNAHLILEFARDGGVLNATTA